MGSDDLFKKRSQGRKARVSKEKKKRAETWLFVCEGKETEPNYFDSLLKYANEKSDKELKYVIKGTGRNTESLVKSIDDFLSYGDDLQKEGYHVLWSNECIELWFLLHFIPLQSNITRQEYFKKLGELLNCTYEKNDNHFEMLNSEENLRKAVHNAKQLYKEFQNEPSYANKAPCTTVFELILELENYLGIKF